MSRRHAAAVLALGLVALVLAWISCTGPTALETRRGSAGGTGATPDAHVAAAPQRNRVAVQPPPGPATTAQQQRTTLRVVARLPGGAPLAGVTVVARFESPRFDAIGDEVARAVTDEAGVALLPLEPGAYEVRASGDDVRTFAQVVTVPERRELLLTFGPGVHLKVRVVDEDDQPLEGATVWERDSGRVARSGADGIADLGAVAAPEPFVTVTAPGHALVRNYVVVGDAREEFTATFRLARGRPLAVRVREEDGSAVPRAEISVYGHGAGFVVRGVADAVGEAVIDGVLSHRKLTINVATPSGRNASIDWTPDPGIDPETAPVALVVLPPGRTLAGVVVNGWTDRPVPGAAVWTRRRDDWEQEIVADQGGRFTLERVPGDAGEDLEIMAYGAGLAPDTDGWGADVTPQGGRLRLVVFPTMTLTGRVVDVAGNPVAGASVLVTTPRDFLPLLPQPLTVSTGPGGTFTVGGVPPVADVVLLAEAPGHGIGWTRAEIPAVPDARHAVADIVLPPRFVLDVPVVDEDGNAVESATLWVRWRVRTRGMGAAFRDVNDGRFDPVDIPQESCAVEIAGPGLVPDVIRVSANTERIVASLPCRVGGRIIDGASGEPIAAGSWVKLTSKDRLHTLEGNHGGGRTGADGRFSAGPLRRGRYELRVEGMEFMRIVDVASRDTALGDIAIE